MQPQTARFGEKLAPLVTGLFLSKVAERCSHCTIADYRIALVHYGHRLDAEGLDPVRVAPTQVKRFLACLRSVTDRRGKPLTMELVKGQEPSGLAPSQQTAQARCGP